MWPNPQETPDLVTFTEEIPNSLRARDGFIQPIFYNRFDCFSL